MFKTLLLTRNIKDKPKKFLVSGEFFINEQMFNGESREFPKPRRKKT
jgi:hypothetical protein